MHVFVTRNIVIAAFSHIIPLLRFVARQLALSLTIAAHTEIMSLSGECGSEIISLSAVPISIFCQPDLRCSLQAKVYHGAMAAPTD